MSNKGDYPNFWVLAVLLVVIGFFVFASSRTNSGPPECDGQDMRRGDACVLLAGSNSDTFTYDEMSERQQGSTLGRLAGGGLMLAGGGIVLFAVARRHPFPGV